MFEQTISDTARREIERVEKLVAGATDAWAIPRVSAEFLHVLVLAGGHRRGLEIGTSYGYSGLWLGAALMHNGGALTTIDRHSGKVKAARETFSSAGLAETIDVLGGKAGDVLESIEGPFDFVFIDADKENCRRYFDLVWPQLGHRATIITDNVTTHAHELAEFLAHLRGHPQLCSTLVPIGSGLEVTVKLDPFAPTTSIDGADWVI